MKLNLPVIATDIKGNKRFGVIKEIQDVKSCFSDDRKKIIILPIQGSLVVVEVKENSFSDTWYCFGFQSIRELIINKNQ